MIDILQETTDWGDQPVSNGIYHVNLQGHLVQHNDKVFKTPLKKIGERVDPATRENVRIVVGSKGQKYIIEDDKCSCPGFKFRGACKHV